MEDKKFSLKQKTVIMLLIQLIGWMSFIVMDYISELVDTSFPAGIILMLPIAVVVGYIVFKIILDRGATFKTNVFEFLIWFGMGVGLSLFIIFLTENDILVEQATGGWDHFLNGVEYILYAGLYVFGGAVVIMIYSVFGWAVGKVKKQKRDEDQNDDLDETEEH